MSNLTLIPSTHPCSTEQWVLEDKETHLCTFQVYEGKVEYVSDIENYYWAKNKNIEWIKAEIWRRERKENEELTKNIIKSQSSQKEWELKYEAEQAEISQWKTENWVCMEGGDGHYDMTGFKEHMRNWENNYYTKIQKEAMLSAEEDKKRVIIYNEGEMRNGELETWK